MFRLIAGVVWGFVLLVPTASPQSAERYLQDAVALHQKGDFEGAIAGYRAYLKFRPDAMDARSNLGAALVHLGAGFRAGGPLNLVVHYHGWYNCIENDGEARGSACTPGAPRPRPRPPSSPPLQPRQKFGRCPTCRTNPCCRTRRSCRPTT